MSAALDFVLAHLAIQGCWLHVEGNSSAVGAVDFSARLGQGVENDAPLVVGQ